MLSLNSGHIKTIHILLCLLVKTIILQMFICFCVPSLTVMLIPCPPIPLEFGQHISLNIPVCHDQLKEYLLLIFVFIIAFLLHLLNHGEQAL